MQHPSHSPPRLNPTPRDPNLMNAGADHCPLILATTNPLPRKAVKPAAALAACRNTTPLTPLNASFGMQFAAITCLFTQISQSDLLEGRLNSYSQRCVMHKSKSWSILLLMPYLKMKSPMRDVSSVTSVFRMRLAFWLFVSPFPWSCCNRILY